MGFTAFCLTTMGGEVLSGETGSAWAFAGVVPNATPAARAASAEKILSVFIEGYFERLQKFNVLRRHFELRLHRLFFERMLVPLDVEGFEEAPVLRRHFRILRLAARQPDRRVKLQHDIESGGANAGDSFGD